MNKAKRIIFLNSYSPRTGHNFMAEVIRLASNCEILTHARAETRLSILLDEFHNVVNPLYFQTARDFHKYLFTATLREQIINFKDSDKNTVMIKDTSMRGVEYLQQHFPDDIHILVTRDPRDTLVSLFKGMRIKDKNKAKRVLKYIGKFIGLYNYTYSKKFQNRYIKETNNIGKSGFHHFKYEDFVSKNETSLKRLLDLFDNSQSIESFVKDIDGIRVINTSFYKEESDSKSTWDAQPKTQNFNPLNRKSLRKVELLAIELGCKKLRKHLGYIN